ncbi:MAG TPA: MdtA/MuxA family multidrug efflux RND transporter periplasmic adaptor subunit [Stellaceae bacterium]|nr:MdtA/MuxA family multidrug efflux RND transporter periplasmic adaptor subunit [Stellaceae bacterium]
MDDQQSEIRAPPARPIPREPGSHEETAAFVRSGTVSRAPAGRRVRRAPARVLVWLLLLAVIGGAAAVIVPRLGHRPTRARFVPPVPVGVAVVKTGDMPVTLSGLGTVTPLAMVTVKTQINGQLTEVGFREGQMVKAGDFLAQIDPRPYQVALEQAEGQRAKDAALLANARTDLGRYNRLIAENSIARQTRDTQASLVAQYQATVAADQAQIDLQKLNLRYAHIIAPIGGRVGLRQVDPGNYVQTSDPNGIVVITQLTPISVVFTLPEDNLPEVLKRLHAGAHLPVVAYDRSGTEKLAEGRLETIDNQIDPTTGTVKLRAVFANADGMLFPNQFVNVRLLVDTVRGVPVVPVTAIQRGEPGTFVYVVKPGDTVAMQIVKLGPSTGETVVVSSGVRPGQQVVVDGTDRLHDGAKVTLAREGPNGGAAPRAGHHRHSAR